MPLPPLIACQFVQPRHRTDVYPPAASPLENDTTQPNTLPYPHSQPKPNVNPKHHLRAPVPEKPTLRTSPTPTPGVLKYSEFHPNNQPLQCCAYTRA
ncbi:hypothetical protein L873DRAFT_1819843 [Choiromyces venosus 120613-1]|uniref:Uncharacterized protein n=1 Tax=Choiromyces venosus 120613-1 TaxID=1336337 RepID=A0A3N4J3L8_9PEZI|nr:hypothetical protein L873DRAFT_1819843 [Choiromyces venosus 120613-1]